MKKKLLAMGASAFTISAFLLTFVATPVQALEVTGWTTYDGTCAPANTKHITTCGDGTDASCTPEGTCP